MRGTVPDTKNGTRSLSQKISKFHKKLLVPLLLCTLFLISKLQISFHRNVQSFRIGTGSPTLSSRKLSQYKTRDHRIYFTKDVAFSVGQRGAAEIDDEKILVSLVITTLQRGDQFSALLSSIANQKQDYFEIIISDHGCFSETEKIIDDHFPISKSKRRIKYMKQCNEIGYKSATQNKAVQLAAESSRWILFLTDYVSIQGSMFIEDLLKLGESKQNAAAVGCKILSNSGEKIIEAGRIIWRDGSTDPFGHNRNDVNAHEFNFPRPIDHVSGTCLMVDKRALLQYGQLEDLDDYSINYQDIDLQMYIQHTLGKEIWYQPRAEIFQTEMSSLRLEESKPSDETSHKKFEEKWRQQLSKHYRNPENVNGFGKEVALTKASDLNTRTPGKATILYFDQEIPDKSRGSGFGRAFDNVSMLANMGHKVTVLSLNDDDNHGGPYNWCSKKCRDELVELGIELVTNSRDAFLEKRFGFYDIVIISRPPVFKSSYQIWRHFYRMRPFAVVYDCEALWYRREEIYANLYKQGIKFPTGINTDNLEATIKSRKKTELAMLSMADFAIPVSEVEKDIVIKNTKNINVETIGAIMTVKNHTRPTFHEREGILYLASFHGSLYYNGDAIWHFLESIYPLVLQEAAKPIPLTIAGRSIPTEIREFVRRKKLQKFVTFRESPHNIMSLYSNSRLFIAPHLYGAGLQYKVRM